MIKTENHIKLKNIYYYVLKIDFKFSLNKSDLKIYTDFSKKGLS